VGGASERGWKPGHLNPTIEEHIDEVVEFDVDAAEIADDDTLVGAGECYYKDVEVSESEIGDEERENEGEDGGGCGIKRKRTIRVIIRSRAFL
jgi:myosin protein heavy chain